MLTKKINRYVELKRALGFKYRIQNSLLQNYALYAKKKGDSYVRLDTVTEWAALAPSPAQRRNRLLTIRRFAIATLPEDDRYEIPPDDIFGKKTFIRRSPYILTSEPIFGHPK